MHLQFFVWFSILQQKVLKIAQNASLGNLYLLMLLTIRLAVLLKARVRLGDLLSQPASLGKSDAGTRT